MKANITVNMSGQEYLNYKKSRQLTKKETTIIAMIIWLVLGVVAIIGLISNLTYVPSDGIYTSYIKGATHAVQGGWESLGMYLIIVFTPFIVIAWIIHGVGFSLVR